MFFLFWNMWEKLTICPRLDFFNVLSITSYRLRASSGRPYQTRCILPLAWRVSLYHKGNWLAQYMLVDAVHRVRRLSGSIDTSRASLFIPLAQNHFYDCENEHGAKVVLAWCLLLTTTDDETGYILAYRSSFVSHFTKSQLCVQGLRWPLHFFWYVCPIPTSSKICTG